MLNEVGFSQVLNELKMKNAMFSTADINKNGSLSLEEMRHYYASLNQVKQKRKSSIQKHVNPLPNPPHEKHVNHGPNPPHEKHVNHGPNPPHHNHTTHPYKRF
jgi:hypothetical protein